METVQTKEKTNNTALHPKAQQGEQAKQTFPLPSAHLFCFWLAMCWDGP